MVKSNYKHQLMMKGGDMDLLRDAAYQCIYNLENPPSVANRGTATDSPDEKQGATKYADFTKAI